MAPRTAPAQISPGDLSAAHAELEGIGNCTACHVLGKSATGDRCLACHKELNSRISDGRGMHATLKDRKCAGCHKEHNGRSFALVQLDPSSFDHARAGFPLEGKHARLACADCHSARFLRDKDVLANPALRRGRTFLGLQKSCSACHTDLHRGQFPAPCQQCHSPEGWKPAAKFLHDRARFVLTGRHAAVRCEQCHTKAADGATVRFVGLSFARCSSCHGDPHNGRFQKSCESCHTTGGWREGAARTFDHSKTKFPLRGRHAAAACQGCHVPGRQVAGNRTVQSFAVPRYRHCSDCHADPHRGEFAGRPDAGACESCHNESGFRPSLFSHDDAGFQLKGRHLAVACHKCHTPFGQGAAGRGPLKYHVARFQACAQCHADIHDGQFARRPDRGACESCHTVEGFLPPRYAPSDHARTRFPLSGAHAAVPCVACHVPVPGTVAKTRRFAWKAQVRCASCHRDPHVPQFSTAKYDGCESCHVVQAWEKLSFGHERTRFPLTGKHAAAACTRCHRSPAPGGSTRYAGTPSRCTDCHTNDPSIQDRRGRG